MLFGPPPIPLPLLAEESVVPVLQQEVCHVEIDPILLHPLRIAYPWVPGLLSFYHLGLKLRCLRVQMPFAIVSRRLP